MAYRFVGLSTGRAGSRYFTKLLNSAGIHAVHEASVSNANYRPEGKIGEVSAHLVTAPLDESTRIWHFIRHPQPFVSSLIKFGFWSMHAPAIHPYLRRTGNALADSYLYWIDWNRRILDLADEPQRITFKIEDVTRETISELASSIGMSADVEKIDPRWNEKQVFAKVPNAVETELEEMMEILGYARSC